MTKPPELLIEEKRLVGTLITKKTHKHSLFISLAMIFLMALVSQVYWQNTYNWAHLLPATNNEVFLGGQWWRVFTAILIHGDFEHFLSNMYMLGIFSFFIFGYFGFTVYPVLTFLFAGLVNALALMTYAPNVHLLGASGLVYLLGGFWLITYFFIQRQYSVFNRSLRVMGVGLMIFFPSTFVPSTSYRTHAIGFIVGALMGAYYFYRNKKEIRSHEVYETSYVAPLLSEEEGTL